MLSFFVDRKLPSFRCLYRTVQQIKFLIVSKYCNSGAIDYIYLAALSSSCYFLLMFKQLPVEIDGPYHTRAAIEKKPVKLKPRLLAKTQVLC